MSEEDCQMASFSTTWLRLLRQLFESFLGFWITSHLKITLMQLRKHETVSALSYLTFFNVLHIWECPGHPYLQSTDSMINKVRETLIICCLYQSCMLLVSYINCIGSATQKPLFISVPPCMVPHPSSRSLATLKRSGSLGTRLNVYIYIMYDNCRY